MNQPGFGTAVRDRSNPSAVTPVGAEKNWNEITSSARCWSRSTDTAFYPVQEVNSRLPAGAYHCRNSNSGIFLEKMPIEIDELLKLPDSAVETLLDEFKKFWKLKKQFEKRGFTYKRGMLMWGPPGSGKTSGIWQMTEILVKELDGIVVFADNPSLTAACVSATRHIEPTRPMICILEDIDALVEEYGEAGYLALLDGETSISNVVYIGTTNYPERLDKRFVDRPSRFDTIMFVDMPSADARRVYFETKEKSLNKEELDRWVKKTEGYSIAHLREVIISIKCLGQTEANTFERLDKMRDEHLKSDGNGGLSKRVGF